MAVEQTRAQVISSIWRGIAQSGVNLAEIPVEQQEKMVDKIADQVLMSMNSLLDEVARPEPAAEAPEAQEEQGEQVLWRGRPFLSLREFYIITTERLKIYKGMLSRDMENIELIRIKDMDINQGVSERMLGIGDITLRGQDASAPDIVLNNISKPQEVFEILRKAWLDARKRYGLQFRDYV
jgi:hypothetical protein